MGAHAGDQQWLVPGVDVAISVRRSHPLTREAGLVVAGADQLHLGTELAHRGHLAGVGVLGGADDGPDSEKPCRICDRLAVIPGRRCNHTGLLLRRSELRDEVHAPAHLERAGGEMVLVLEVDVGAQDLAEGGRLADGGFIDRLRQVM